MKDARRQPIRGENRRRLSALSGRFALSSDRFAVWLVGLCCRRRRAPDRAWHRPKTSPRHFWRGFLFASSEVAFRSASA